MNYGITFGGWLKERRRAQGISHDEFADRIACSRITLLKMESEERRPSRQMALLLAQYFQIPADEHEAFVTFARAGHASSPTGDAPTSEAAMRSPWRAPLQHKTNLPYLLTPLIGREREEEEARNHLLQWRVRILTLTGPPGIGKTRLATQIASSVFDQYDDGVYFVDLSPVTDPDDVPAAIARSVGLAATGSTLISTALQEYLSRRRMLLLLDNFEHLLDAASTVVKLLEAGPWLKVLITSREALNVRGERRFVVQPLATPAKGQSYSPSALLNIPSVELFIDRAQFSDSDFELTDENAQDVAAICAGLEGLPLAIELAAARTADLSMRELREAMSAPLRLLAGGRRDLPLRQRTLRSAIEWSYNLLSNDEQALLRSLSVFAGGFTREAAEQVGSASDEEHSEHSDALLRSLADKSLVKRESKGSDSETRFGMLEAIREYALHMLAVSEEEGSVRLRHARYFLSLAQQAFANQSGPRQLLLRANIDVDYSNVIAALQWLLTNGRHDTEIAELAALMASYLCHYWDWRAYFAEGREWIEQTLALGDRLLWHDRVNEGAHTGVEAHLLQIQGRLLNGVGLLVWRLGDNNVAIGFFNNALRTLTRLGNKAGMWAVLSNIAILQGEQGRYDLSFETFRQALEIGRELGYDRIAMTLNNLGAAYWNSGDVENARAMYEESLTRYRQMDDPGNMTLPLDNLGIIAQYHEEYEAARRYQEEALALCRTYGHKNSLAHVLANMGSRAVAEGDYASAREAYGELLPLLQQQSYHQVIVSCLEGIATLSYKLGGPIEAARLWGAAEHLREVNKHPMSVPSIKRYEQSVAAALEQSDPDAFQLAWNEGRAMSIEEAIVCALECL
jgi:predicted ATPase/DNA-binding XRE family transcriptional regulator/Tfp pilus assembly protein PilF